MIGNNELQYDDLQPAASINYTITSLPSSGFLALSSDAGTPIMSFTQADINSGILTYVHGGTEGALDQFTFSVDDGQGNQVSGQLFDITVLPVNDSPLLISNEVAIVDEGQSVTITPSMLSAVDADDVAAELTYTLTSSPTTGSLSVNGVSLSIGDTFTQDQIDQGQLSYEHDDSENFIDLFQFSLADGGEDGSLAPNGIFVIAINPVNDNPISIVNDVDSANNEIQENNLSGSQVGITAAASDVDTGDSISYSLFDNDGGRFEIDEVSGVVTLAGSVDRETDGASRNITVRATSTDGTFSDEVFVIDIVDVDEFDVDVVFDSDSSVNEISEQAVAGTPVGLTAFASDLDATTNAITYSLDDNAGGRFAIDGVSGVVTIADDTLIDFETDESHAVTIRATSDDGSSVARIFNIDVLDFNEHAPVIGNQVFDVAENSTNGTSVGNVVASDADSSQLLSYSITGGTGVGIFAIDSFTGEITVAYGTQLDHELISTYTLEVAVTDDLSPVLTSTATMTINVSDVNEAAAVSLTNVVNSIQENTDTSNGIRIADVNIIDDALGTNLLSLTGADSALFELDGDQLRLLAGVDLDFETFTQLDVTISVDDLTIGNTVEDTVSHSLAITDVADSAPVVQAGQVFNVLENSVNGTLVGGLVVNDIDSSGPFQNFTIHAGNEAGLFEVQTDGTIRVADGMNLDHEAASQHNLQVSVSDGRSESAIETVVVTVADVNEAPTAEGESFTAIQFDQIVVAQSSGLLANDFDQDFGNALEVILVAGPANGTLQLNSDGSFVYTSNGSFFGTDSFAYIASDGLLTSDPITVQIDVAPLNAMADNPGSQPEDGGGDSGDGEVNDKSEVTNSDSDSETETISTSTPVSTGQASNGTGTQIESVNGGENGEGAVESTAELEGVFAFQETGEDEEETQELVLTLGNSSFRASAVSYNTQAGGGVFGLSLIHI